MVVYDRERGTWRTEEDLLKSLVVGGNGSMKNGRGKAVLPIFENGTHFGHYYWINSGPTWLELK